MHVQVSYRHDCLLWCNHSCKPVLFGYSVAEEEAIRLRESVVAAKVTLPRHEFTSTCKPQNLSTSTVAPPCVITETSARPRQIALVKSRMAVDKAIAGRNDQADVVVVGGGGSGGGGLLDATDHLQFSYMLPRVGEV
jgi:hypothetical protein